jgi:hypothetical protein
MADAPANARNARFRIEVERTEGKWKLNRNHPAGEGRGAKRYGRTVVVVPVKHFGRIGIHASPHRLVLAGDGIGANMAASSNENGTWRTHRILATSLRKRPPRSG